MATAEKIVQDLPLDKVRPNPNQPRKRFDEDKLRELAAAIQSRGVQQPILVRKVEGGLFELIMGERRLRASRLIGKATIPALVVDATDEESAHDALTENLQREDLTPIEEARALSALADRNGGNVQEIAFKIGKSVVFVRARIELLKLTESVQHLLEQGKISLEQAQILLQIDDPEKQIQAAEQAVHRNLSANQLKGITQHLRKGRGNGEAPRRVTPKRLSQKLLELNDLADTFQPPPKIKSDVRELLSTHIEGLVETLGQAYKRLTGKELDASRDG